MATFQGRKAAHQTDGIKLSIMRKTIKEQLCEKVNKDIGPGLSVTFKPVDFQVNRYAGKYGFKWAARSSKGVWILSLKTMKETVSKKKPLVIKHSFPGISYQIS